jgi:[acyl-carrier-protein] S-malonyltransferase
VIAHRGLRDFTARGARPAGPEPDLVAGHSLGEYTALVAAGALAFRDAVPFVRIRAQAMLGGGSDRRRGHGGDTRLDDEALKAACNDAAQGQVVEPVNSTRRARW